MNDCSGNAGNTGDMLVAHGRDAGHFVLPFVRAAKNHNPAKSMIHRAALVDTTGIEPVTLRV
jgi:hypothetical protein